MNLITASDQVEFSKAARTTAGRRRILKVLAANQQGRDRISICLAELVQKDPAAESDSECVAAREMLANIEETSAWLEALLLQTSTEILA